MTSRLGAWFKALRPFSYTAAVTPSLVGAALAYNSGTFNWLHLVLFTASATLFLAGTNLTNEYYDDLRGLDKVQKVGHSGMLQAGMLTPRQVLRGAIASFALGAIVGLVLVAVTGSWRLVPLGFAGLLAGFSYTGGPYPASYYPFGELVVFIFMGPALVMGSYFTQVGTVNALAFWLSIPIGLLVAAILHVNNVRDIDFDVQFGRRTIPILIGRPLARIEYLGMIGGSYGVVAVLVLLGYLSWWALLPVLTLPLAADPVRTLFATEDTLQLNRTLRETARLHALFGLLLALGITLGAWL